MKNGIILVVTAPISVISSILIVVMILRSRVKLSNSYHRLMFGMSAIDIMHSSALSFSSLPAPIGTPDSWITIGNQSTCSVQGFFVMFGILPYYFLSLQFYYLFMIKYQTSVDNMKKVEPYLHGAPILLGLISASVSLFTDSMNPGSRGYCWLQDFPLHCGKYTDIECTRGIHMSTLRPILVSAPFILITILSFGIMWTIHVAVRNQEKRNISHQLESGVMMSRDRLQEQISSCSVRRASLPRSLEETRKTQYARSHKARKRILQYFIAYFITYVFLFLDAFCSDINNNLLDDVLEILVMIFYPLWGFYNLLVFILPAVHKVKKRNIGFSFPRSFYIAMVSYVGPSGGDSRKLRQERRESITLQNVSSMQQRIQESVLNSDQNSRFSDENDNNLEKGKLTEVIVT